MTKPPASSTNNDSESSDSEYLSLDAQNLESIDTLSPEEVAEQLYALAEKVIADPRAYQVEFGLSALDISELDNIDLSTPEGRKKLAKLFRLLAQQVFKGKKIYFETVRDPSQQQKGQSR